MKNPLRKTPDDSSFVKAFFFFAVLMMAASPLLASTSSFVVPNDIALRIRLDDTLTSVDSSVGDPFSATVVDQGEYQNARVYGHIAEIQTSGRVTGHTSMVLRFDRLVMPDGRRAPIHPKSLNSITHLQARKSMWKEQSNQVVGAARPSSTQRSERALVHC
jgi:hypothetical protein